MVGLFLKVYSLLLAFVVTDDEIGKTPLLHRPTDIMGTLVECIPQESVTLPGDPLHLTCHGRVVCLRVMPLHLFGPEERHLLVEPLVAGLYRSALDNNGCMPLVVCHGCEVIKARVKHHDPGRAPVSADDISFLR